MTTVLNLLNKAAVKLMETMDLPDLQKTVVHEGLKIVKARYGSIYISSKGKLERTYTTLPHHLQVQIRKKGFTYQCYKKQKILFINAEEVVPVHQELKDFEVKSVVMIPLSYRKKCVGVLSFDSNKSRFTQKEIKLLTLYGSMASLAITQAKLYQEEIKAVELRDLFISLTAHEFRTPLTTINGYAQLLKRKLEKEKSGLLQWAEELNSEVKRLTEMTNELLEISRIKSGKIDYTFKESHLLEIVEKAIARFKFSFPENELVLTNKLYVNDKIIADYDKILQVFSNILENAGKFSPPGQPVKIIVTRKRNWLITTIRDSGRGISKDDLEKIFMGFYKGENSDHKQGMGLGLYISKSITDAHQGKLKVTSKLNKGTAFSVWLPQQDYEPSK